VVVQNGRASDWPADFDFETGPIGARLEKQGRGVHPLLSRGTALFAPASLIVNLKWQSVQADPARLIGYSADFGFGIGS
jgi:hypothetical protein